MTEKHSKHDDGDELPKPVIGLFCTMSTMLAYGLLVFFGRIRDAWRLLFPIHAAVTDGFAPIVTDFEDFFTRRLYHRISDCWNRPVAGCPGASIDVMHRVSDGYQSPLKMTGTVTRCVNLGSYNYLGFGDPDSPTKPAVLNTLDMFGVSSTSPRSAAGSTSVHTHLERALASFMGKEAAMVFGMGFGTNSTVIPALVGKGGLIVSDKVNHRSLVVGARSGDAVVKVFNHNDADHLERVIRRAILEGQPKSRRPWKKILIVCEGIYSMEGEMSPLEEIVRVKKKYNCYLYVDEAHSIGAIGASGRGITEDKHVDPKDIDILMGTFTKSFGAVGGYIAASADTVAHLKRTSAGYQYSASISAAAAQQVISALEIITGQDNTTLGRVKLGRLRENSDYFRCRLLSMGLHVMGDWGSPIVPVMLYNPSKICAFSRECLDRGVAVVVVGFPASPLLLGRTRFCISAAHTREELDYALKVIEEVIDLVGVRFGTPVHLRAPTPPTANAQSNNLSNSSEHKANGALGSVHVRRRSDRQAT